jgi:hypothetical protein
MCEDLGHAIRRVAHATAAGALELRHEGELTFMMSSCELDASFMFLCACVGGMESLPL